MAMPYAPNFKRTDFKIRYEGKADAFFCFRIDLRSAKGNDALAMRCDVAEWLLTRVTGKFFMGNGFGASKEDPVVPFPNPGGTDAFVLFSALDDVRSFEKRYCVFGFSPTMTM